MRRGVYPGTFDPVTYGHIDIIERSSKLVDELIIGILENKTKSPLFSVEERVRMLLEVTQKLPNVKIMTFDGLLVDFVKQVDAQVIIRGLRNANDFEYELQMAQTNSKIQQGVETIFLPTRPEHSYISSSAVREIASFDGDISNLVPNVIEQNIKDKLQSKGV